MFPPFETTLAKSFLTDAISMLQAGEIKLVRQASPSAERANEPLMIGVLICLDKNNKQIPLLAISGNAFKIQLNNKKQPFTIAPSIVSYENITQAMAQNNTEIHLLTKKLKLSPNDDDKIRLKKLCSQSLQKVYNLYNFNCIDGKMRSLKEICRTYNNDKLAPTGTGDCCEPKLLDYAFKNNLKPISMAESFYSATDQKSNKKCKLVFPCDNRCAILLPAMLGLKILYRDEHIIIVNKQSGLLSVPGRTPDKQDCIVNRVKKLFPQTINQPAVHRLDMETSGIMILAFTKDAHKNLNSQFENKLVQKEYIALLDGVLAQKNIAPQGTMELFFRLDIENRPHQIWDRENGKSAITQWQILNVERYHAPDGTTRNATRVLFKPHTGRTHQLRLASSDSHGFGVPIIGDTLYGTCKEGERLMLHAQRIIFTHPITNEKMDIFCKSEF